MSLLVNAPNMSVFFVMIWADVWLVVRFRFLSRHTSIGVFVGGLSPQ